MSIGNGFLRCSRSLTTDQALYRRIMGLGEKKNDSLTRVFTLHLAMVSLPSRAEGK